MKQLSFGALMLSSLLVLSACGGGKGSTGSSLDVGEANGEPRLTSAHVREQFAEIGRMADRLDMTSLRVSYGPSAGTTVGADCFDAARCTPATDEFGLIFTPEILSTIPPNAEMQGRGSRQGVPVVEYAGTFGCRAAIWEPPTSRLRGLPHAWRLDGLPFLYCQSVEI